jgi:hypothetical protein
MLGNHERSRKRRGAALLKQDPLRLFLAPPNKAVVSNLPNLQSTGHLRNLSKK